MLEKIPEKVLKKPENPYGIGILRLQVLEILLSASEPITVTEMIAVLRKEGVRHNHKTLYQSIYEISHCFKLFEVQYIQRRAGKSRAAAFFVTHLNSNTHVQPIGQSVHRRQGAGLKNDPGLPYTVPDRKKYQNRGNGGAKTYPAGTNESWRQIGLFPGTI